jgi:flagellar L-ring protein precursor FlgH
MLLALGGCAMMPKKGDQHADIESLQTPRMPPVHVNGTIYNAGTELTLFEDVKAHRVGDILTVTLMEATSGSKSSDAKATQSSSMSIDPPIIGGVTKTNISLDAGAANKFAGESGSSQSNSLTGSITVTVTDVLPGGNLRVKGEKWVEINHGKEYIQLEGIIRPRDVKPNNTILSTQVADARISYSGSGSSGNMTVLGWISSLLFSPLRPF